MFFVQAHRRHYAFEICPGFWDCLIHHHQTARLISVDRVRDEILAGDALEAWVKNSAPKTLFASTADAAVVADFAAMVQWVQAETAIQERSEVRVCASRRRLAGRVCQGASAPRRGHP